MKKYSLFDELIKTHKALITFVTFFWVVMIFVWQMTGYNMSLVEEPEEMHFLERSHVSVEKYSEQKAKGYFLLDINTATFLELVDLPGLGEVKANAIIEYRNKHGYFKKARDLMRVDGIDYNCYKQFKDKIKV